MCETHYLFRELSPAVKCEWLSALVFRLATLHYLMKQLTTTSWLNDRRWTLGTLHDSDDTLCEECTLQFRVHAIVVGPNVANIEAASGE